MLKKVSQSFDNKFGMEHSSGGFPNKPCVLGMVPISGNVRDCNGYLNLFMYLLQIRKGGSIDSDYDIKDIPFDLLINNEKEEVEALILNAIPANNINEAKKIMRNINIMSYCDGNNKTGLTLKKLYLGLVEKGYTTDEAKEILSQIFVIQIVDNYHEEHQKAEIPYATVVTVHDIYDMENREYLDQEDKLFEDNPFIHTESKDNNDRYVLYKSFGEGSLAQRRGEHMFEKDYAKAPIINYLIALYLIKVLHMSINSIELNNISVQKEINELLVKVQQFAKMKNKHYDEFTKEDLIELNEYLMQDIKNVFKENIPIKTISQEEQEYLNNRDSAIRQFYDRNYIDLEREVKYITDLANKIYEFNDNFSDDDIAYIEHSNDGAIEHKKGSAIKYHLEILSLRINEFMSKINKLVMPKNISAKVLSELTDYITNSLNNVKNVIYNDKMQLIIEEYADKEIQNGLRI